MHSHQLAATGVYRALTFDSDGIGSTRGVGVNGKTTAKFISGCELDATDNDSQLLDGDDGNDETDASDAMYGLNAAAHAERILDAAERAVDLGQRRLQRRRRCHDAHAVKADCGGVGVLESLPQAQEDAGQDSGNGGGGCRANVMPGRLTTRMPSTLYLSRSKAAYGHETRSWQKCDTVSCESNREHQHHCKAMMFTVKGDRGRQDPGAKAQAEAETATTTAGNAAGNAAKDKEAEKKAAGRAACKEAKQAVQGEKEDEKPRWRMLVWLQVTHGHPWWVGCRCQRSPSRLIAQENRDRRSRPAGPAAGTTRPTAPAMTLDSPLLVASASSRPSSTRHDA
jgi:hypothetical protein